MPDHLDELTSLLCRSVSDPTLQKILFSTPRSSKLGFIRVAIRPIEVRGSRMIQFTSQSATQQFHQNYDEPAAAIELVRLATKEFRNIHLVTGVGSYEARFSRKGKCFLRMEARRQAKVSKEVAGIETSLQSANPSGSHNRVRNYLIPEGVPCPFLVQTGVMSKDGDVHTSHSRKFRQINRFLEFIHDVVDQLPTDRTIQVVDFGCGKSYLTFATQYLLTSLLKRDCQIIGLDQRSDVVETCQKIAEELGLSNLEFEVGDIAGYDANREIDLVISLHACDTATDDAIAKAVCWQSRVILAVPCCQKELNGLLKPGTLSPITSFGLTKERFASMATDTIRATLMKVAGYETQLVEFIDMEHTPKNILIRGIRKSKSGEAVKLAGVRAMKEHLQMRTLLDVPPLALERRLTEQKALAWELG